LSKILRNTRRHNNRNIPILCNIKKDSCKIALEDGKVGKLPKGFIQLLALRVPCSARTTDESGLYRNYDYFYYVDRPFLESCGATVPENALDYRQFFTIRNGYIYFNQDAGEEIEMAFTCSNVDDEGFMLIYRRFQSALQYYAAWQFAVINSDSYTNIHPTLE